MIGDVRIPSNLEAERAVLGAILIHNDTMDTAAALLQPTSFYRRAHQQIFAAMLDLHNARTAIDFTLLTNRLTQKQELDDVGGPAYLADLTSGLPHSANVDHYAAIVREKATLRDLQMVGSKLMAAASAAEAPALDVLAEADHALMQLAADHVSGDLMPGSALMHALYPVLEEAYKNKRQITGLQTSWRDLDELTLGLHPGTLVYLAGRTSQGKSALCLNIASDIALQGHTVAYFSIEDSREQIAMRLAAAQSGVSLFRMRSGYLVDRDWDPIARAMADIGNSKIFIDDTPRMSVQELRAKSRRLQSVHGLALIVVDYVQMMHAPGKHQNRASELAMISNGLKQIAKELKVPILAAAQLNRDNDKQERRPRLSDLRDSGSLEQDGDVVILLHRPEQQNPTLENEGLTEIHVAKQRNGPTGTIKLRFLKDEVRFVSWQEREQPQERMFSS